MTVDHGARRKSEAERARTKIEAGARRQIEAGSRVEVPVEDPPGAAWHQGPEGRQGASRRGSATSKCSPTQHRCCCCCCSCGLAEAEAHGAAGWAVPA